MRKTLILALAVWLAGCGGEKHGPTESAKKTPQRVTTETVQLSRWPEIYRATGTVQATTKATISARVTGAIRAMKVAIGSRVAAGETLIELDDRELAAMERQADGARREARAAMPEVESAIAAAQASLRLAESTHGRLRGLFDRKSITPQEMDEANSRLELARAQVAIASSRRAQVESKIEQAEQAWESARVARGHTAIKAPFAGLVVEKMAEAGTMASPGVPLLVIEQSGAYQVEVPVEESRVGQIKTGQTVTLVSGDGTTGTSRVREVVPAMDPATRTVLVKVPVTGRAGVRGGEFARAEWRLGDREVLTVPEGAVRATGQLRMVCVVEKGTAQSRMVTVGETAGGRVEVLSGLRAGEVIVSAATEIEDGTPVEVRQ